jgi:hypothetical protein
MNAPARPNQPKPRSSSCYSIRQWTLMDWLKLLGSLLVPVMIGVITFVLSIQESRLAESNCLNDLRIADLQRQQEIDLADQLRTQTIVSDFKGDVIMLIASDQTQPMDAASNDLQWGPRTDAALSAVTRATMDSVPGLTQKREIILFLHKLDYLIVKTIFVSVTSI